MKKVLAAILLACFALSIAACGGAPAAPETTTAAPETTAAATTTAATTTAATTTEAPADEDEGLFSGEIVISLNYSPDGDTTRFEYLRDAYKKVQPNVTLLWEAQAGDQYPTWLTTQLASGNIRPDIVAGNYSKEFTGYVNLNLYRNRMNPYTGNLWGDELNFDLINERNAKGEKYMLPSEAVHILWFYNKDIFDEVGIEPPATDADFVEICEKLLEAGYTPFASNWGWQANQWFVEVYYDQFARAMDEYLRAQPGDWCFDEDLDGTYKYDAKNINQGSNYTYSPQRLYYNIKNGNYKFDGPEFIAWATAYQKMFNSKYNYPEFSVDNDHYARFLTGRTAMMSDGTWSLTGLANDLAGMSPERLASLKLDPETSIQAFDWSTFENPEMTGEHIQGPVRSVESASGIYLSIVDKGAEQVDMCVDFVHYWLSQPGYQAWVDGALASTHGYSPAGPIQVAGVTLPPDMQETLDNIKMKGNAEYPGKMPNAMASSEFEQLMKDSLLKLLNQEITPEEYARETQKVYDDNFEKIIINMGLTMEDVEYPEREPS